jgi:hypothetical protein
MSSVGGLPEQLGGHLFYIHNWDIRFRSPQHWFKTLFSKHNWFK